MDPYSFLNTAHSAYFAELYDQYLINPESVEPSWRAFFQGFEFGIDKVEKGEFHVRFQATLSQKGFILLKHQKYTKCSK